MTKHDTAAIRKLAGRLEAIARELSEAERGAAGKIAELNGELAGDTPRAIEDASGKLSGELKSIHGGLTRNAETLYRYARELDIADEKAQREISSR